MKNHRKVPAFSGAKKIHVNNQYFASQPAYIGGVYLIHLNLPLQPANTCQKTSINQHQIMIPLDEMKINEQSSQLMDVAGHKAKFSINEGKQMMPEQAKRMKIYTVRGTKQGIFY